MLFKRKHPSVGCVYAITAGKYLGELLVFVEEKNKVLKFLSLPTMALRDVPQDKFDVGIKSKIVDFVERLPKDIFSTCIKQYRKNTTLNK